MVVVGIVAVVVGAAAIAVIHAKHTARMSELRSAAAAGKRTQQRAREKESPGEGSATEDVRNSQKEEEELKKIPTSTSISSTPEHGEDEGTGGEEKKQAEPKAEKTREGSPIVQGWRTLPSDFEADNHRKLLSVIEGRLGGGTVYKDKFETETEFERRTRQALAGRLLGSLTVEDVYVFRESKASFDYDLGEEEFRYAVGKVEHLEGRLLGQESYVGVNLFGVRREVLKTKHEMFGLKISNLEAFDARAARGMTAGPVVRVKMDRESAREADGKLQVFYVCRLEHPYISAEYGGRSPTIDSPYEDTTVHRYLHVKLIECCVARSDTGEIMARLRQRESAVEAVVKEKPDKAGDGEVVSREKQVDNKKHADRSLWGIWSGVVDGVDDILITNDGCSLRHIEWQPPTKVSWEAKVALPQDEERTVVVQTLRGRGRVALREQPSKENGYRATVRIEDRAPGADRYLLRVLHRLPPGGE